MTILHESAALASTIATERNPFISHDNGTKMNEFRMKIEEAAETLVRMSMPQAACRSSPTANPASVVPLRPAIAAPKPPPPLSAQFRAVSKSSVPLEKLPMMYNERGRLDMSEHSIIDKNGAVRFDSLEYHPDKRVAAPIVTEANCDALNPLFIAPPAKGETRRVKIQGGSGSPFADVHVLYVPNTAEIDALAEDVSDAYDVLKKKQIQNYSSRMTKRGDAIFAMVGGVALGSIRATSNGEKRRTVARTRNTHIPLCWESVKAKRATKC